MRARAFTQDDADVFCLPEHIDGEVASFCELLRRVYARFGFQEFVVGFSTRPAAREGSDALWDEAQATLAAAARAAGLEFRLQPGEGAFYGPKLEFSLKEVSAGMVTIRERGGERSVRSLSDTTDWLKVINALN